MRRRDGDGVPSATTDRRSRGAGAALPDRGRAGADIPRVRAGRGASHLVARLPAHAGHRLGDRRGAGWLGKKELFRAPFGGVMRRLGGVAVDRDDPGSLVADMVTRAASGALRPGHRARGHPRPRGGMEVRLLPDRAGRRRPDRADLPRRPDAHGRLRPVVHAERRPRRRHGDRARLLRRQARRQARPRLAAAAARRGGRERADAGLSRAGGCGRPATSSPTARRSASRARGTGTCACRSPRWWSAPRPRR